MIIHKLREEEKDGHVKFSLTYNSYEEILINKFIAFTVFHIKLEQYNPSHLPWLMDVLYVSTVDVRL